MPTEHSHVMGGSSATQRIHCPGSLALEKSLPDGGTESDFAKRGSMLHAATELVITADPKDLSAAELLFVDLVGQDLGFGEDFKMTWDLVDTKLRPAIEVWFKFLAEWDIDDYFIEQRVSLGTVVEGAFGTADIIAKDTKGWLHVLDWKFGDGVPVSAVENLGLGFYAAAAMYDEDPELVEFCDNVEGVVLHIVQPRTAFPDENPWQTWETDAVWIEQLVDRIVAAMDVAIKPDAPTKPGDWCRWCDAKAICPAQHALAGQALSIEPKSLSAIQLADAMHIAETLKPWITSIFELAQTEMEGGAAIPGYKLVNKRPRRVYVNQEAAQKSLRGKKMKAADIMAPRELISPAQLEKVMGKPAYKKFAEDNVVMVSSGVTVAPDTDKRQAVTGSMELLANAMQKAGK